MASNICYSTRSILKKELTGTFKDRTNLDSPQNEHAVMTLLSTLLTIPFLFYLEGHEKILKSYNDVSLVPDKQVMF